MPEPAAVPSTPAAQAAAARLAGMKPPPRPATTAAGGAALAPVAASKKEAKKQAKAAARGAGEAEKKKKKPIKPIAMVVLLLLVGYVVKGKVVKPHYAPGEAVPPGAVVSIGTVTTNLSDGHLAQVAISIQLTKAANAKLVAKDQPEMVSAVVTDLGEATYAGLLAPAGRAALRVRLLRTFQQQLGLSEGAEQASGVYFTGFVLQ